MIPRPPDFAAWTWQTPEENPVPDLLALLMGAKRLIRVSAFGFTLAPVVDELIQAHWRGVDVKLILDNYQAQGKAAKAQITKLEKANVPFIVATSARGGLMHLKVILVDDAIWTGSWNISESASKQDNDVYLLQMPPGFSSKRLAKFEKEWARLTEKAARKAKTN